jgi:hypothetical protein
MTELATPSAPSAPAQLGPPDAGRPEAAAVVWRWRERRGGEDRVALARALRRRGLLGGAIGLGAAGLLSLWKTEAALVVGGIAIVLTTLALVSPLGAFRRVTAVLERFAHAVGLTLTWLLMGLAYYLLFLPVGLFLRATGKLRLVKRPDPSRPSYWRPATRRPEGLDAYRRQF